MRLFSSFLTSIPTHLRWEQYNCSFLPFFSLFFFILRFFIQILCIVVVIILVLSSASGTYLNLNLSFDEELKLLFIVSKCKLHFRLFVSISIYLSFWCQVRRTIVYKIFLWLSLEISCHFHCHCHQFWRKQKCLLRFETWFKAKWRGTACNEVNAWKMSAHIFKHMLRLHHCYFLCCRCHSVAAVSMMIMIAFDALTVD